MLLTYPELKNKVLGCWIGKNIGGTLGGPFEGKLGLLDIDFYTHDLNGSPLPNDDLDLQLVWLNAVEKYGRRVDSQILSEYWLSHIYPDWAEYGACKANMRAGLIPPLTGVVNNPHMNSCGAFIRSEIWACLAPGNPQLAVKYAIQDAIVDHAYEGVYGEVFCAAIQSAAFVESDKFKLIDIGFSYIPDNCGIKNGVEAAVKAYKDGNTWQEAYKIVMNTVPGSFSAGIRKKGMQYDVPAGEMGYDAPSNIAIFVLGWLYGEDDLGKSLCIAVNCGEDTDCTAATLGAVFGIINGADKMPKKWVEPIGYDIVTCSINAADQTINVPKNLNELTDRIVTLIPRFLDTDIYDISGNYYTVNTCNNASLYAQPYKGNYWTTDEILMGNDISPFKVCYNFDMMKVVIDYIDGPFLTAEKPKTFNMRIRGTKGTPEWLKIKWFVPEGIAVSPAKETSIFMYQFYHSMCEAEFEISVNDNSLQRVEAVIEISITGRHTKNYLPVVLINEHGKAVSGYTETR